MNQEEQDKRYGQLIAKAWADEEFKAKLKADPKAAMAEVGMDLAEGVDIEVVESTPEKAYLVIPPKPEAVGELSDEDLEKVAGGMTAELSPGPPTDTVHGQWKSIRGGGLRLHDGVGGKGNSHTNGISEWDDLSASKS